MDATARTLKLRRSAARAIARIRNRRSPADEEVDAASWSDGLEAAFDSMRLEPIVQPETFENISHDPNGVWLLLRLVAIGVLLGASLVYCAVFPVPEKFVRIIGETTRVNPSSGHIETMLVSTQVVVDVGYAVYATMLASLTSWGARSL